MRRWLPLLILACFACKSNDEGEGSKAEAEDSSASSCDLDKLESLAQALPSDAATERGSQAWAGIEEACSASVPGALRAHFDPAWTEGSGGSPLGDLVIKACPDWSSVSRALADSPADLREAVAFRGCDFGRFEVIEDVEADGPYPLLAAWALHQWLLDQGLDAAHARPITRAMLELDRSLSAPVQRVAQLDFPPAPGLSLGAGEVVYVTKTKLTFDDRTLFTLEGGELPKDIVRGAVVPSIFEALSEAAEAAWGLAGPRGEATPGPLFVAADSQTPSSTVLAVLLSAASAGYTEVSFVVETPEGALALLPIESPSARGPMGFGDRGAVMTIELDADGVSLAKTPNELEVPPVELGPGDAQGILAFARQVTRDDPRAHRLVLSAASSVPFHRVISAIVAARGPDCRGTDGCLLPDVIVAADNAHTAGASFRTAEDDVWGGLTGTEVGEAYGVGGLGLIGAGRDEGTIALGNTGLIGGGSGGSGKRVPRVRQAKAKVTGSLNRDIIRRIVRAHINEVRSCYNAGLTKNPNLQGRVVIDFTIGGTGKVTSSTVQESTLTDKSVANCVAKAVKRWTFPKPRGGGAVQVTYPFTLSPG